MLNRTAQIDQLAVEKMTGVRHADQQRLRTERFHPVVDRLWINDLVGVTLYQQPLRRRLYAIEVPATGGWCDRNQHLRLKLAGHAQCDVGAETEAGQPQRITWTLRTYPVGNRAEVFTLANAMIEMAGRCADTAKVEAHHRDAQLAQRARRHGHHFVMHRAALGGERVTDDRGDVMLWRTGLGQIDCGLNRANRSFQCQGAGFGGESGIGHATMISPRARMCGFLVAQVRADAVARPRTRIIGSRASRLLLPLTMPFLLLAVACSVLVSVLLKLAVARRLDIVQMVAGNYLVATVLALLVLQPSLATLRTPQAPWLTLLGLAIALPSIFLVLARSVALAGIVRSDVAQRLSLLLSLAAAFALFDERANGYKLVGLALGVLAVAGIAARSRTPAPAPSVQARGGPWLLGVWVGFALIDVLLKHVAQSGASSLAALTVCFAIAGTWMTLWLAIAWLRGRIQLTGRNLVAGALLGVLNFGNILCYVRAHQALPESPAVVFATMNIGVVVVGAVVGTLVFGERTNGLNRIALALAVLAIALIARGTFAT